MLAADARACLPPAQGVPDGAFDALLANHVLEHIPDMWAGLTAWTRTLSHGGVLLFTVPNGCSELEILRRPTSIRHFHLEYQEGLNLGAAAMAASREAALRARHADEMTLGSCTALRFGAFTQVEAKVGSPLNALRRSRGGGGEGAAGVSVWCPDALLTLRSSSEWAMCEHITDEASFIRLGHLHIWHEDTLRESLLALAQELSDRAAGGGGNDVCFRVLDLHSSLEG